VRVRTFAARELRQSFGMLAAMARLHGAALLLLLACGTGPAGDPDAASTSDAATTSTTTSSATSSAASTGSGELPTSTDAAESTSAAPGETTTSESGESSGESTTGGGAAVYDPDLDGPWDIVEIAGAIDVGQVEVAIEGFYPSGGPEPGPYPLVVVAHGFQLPPSQYTSYVRRLATHGYVAVTADFQAALFNTDHVANTQQVLAAIDWAAAEPTLAGVVDAETVGLTGHSLGGKLAVHGAALDPRVRASITLDPVDGSQMCDAQKCPDVTDMLPLDVPLGFLGETLDGSGGFMSCAPEANNFLTFFAAASAPALAVTVNGANHMSFLDDVASCGLTCSLCKMPTLDNATVNRLARAYVVAFYGLYLKGEPGYETFLTGDAAQTRYVGPGLVTLATK